MLDLTRPVQWTTDRTHVGRVELVKCGTFPAEPYITIFGRVLVRHAHTGELEFVPMDLLSNYPSEPIPEPT